MPRHRTAQMEPRGGYADPRTPHGQKLSELSRSVGGLFFLHETGLLKQGCDWHFPNVLSPFWRLYQNPKDGWLINHEGKAWPLAADEVLLIPDGTVFDCVGEKGIPHLWIHFSLANPLPSVPTTPIRLALSPTLRSLCKALREAHTNGADTTQHFHLAAALLHAAFAEVKTTVIQTYPQRLVHLLHWMQDQLALSTTNADLAKQAGLSESAFIRWFHGHIGETPAVYLQRLRMKTAAHALATTAHSIEEIASQIGFKNRYHFTRIFQQHFKIGPAGYRQQVATNITTHRERELHEYPNGGNHHERKPR